MIVTHCRNIYRGGVGVAEALLGNENDFYLAFV